MVRPATKECLALAIFPLKGPCPNSVEMFNSECPICHGEQSIGDLVAPESSWPELKPIENFPMTLSLLCGRGVIDAVIYGFTEWDMSTKVGKTIRREVKELRRPVVAP